MSQALSEHIPRVGAVATVRNRRGVVSSVDPYDGDAGRLHLVHLEYKDDQLPPSEKLLWTGLLEILDPVRFSQTGELRPAEKERIRQVVLRRLKREINDRSSQPKFCTRGRCRSGCRPGKRP